MTGDRWPLGPGVLELPDGVRVRGRALRGAIGPLPPDRGLFLLGRRPPAVAWPSTWIRWPDFALPLRWSAASRALLHAHERAAVERVEVVCGGGRGRTGTALASLATVAGLAPGDAVDYVRANYDRHAVEVPWQRLFVHWFHRTTTSEGPSA